VIGHFVGQSPAAHTMVRHHCKSKTGREHHQKLTQPEAAAPPHLATAAPHPSDRFLNARTTTMMIAFLFHVAKSRV
jgi:hypothetical protein